MSAHTRLMSRHPALGVAALAVVGLLAACSFQTDGGFVVGSGEATTEARTVGDFTEIEGNSAVRVEVEVGKPTAVSVTAQPNILAITTTEVAGSRLTINTRSGYTSVQGVTANVSTPQLSAVELTGAASASGGPVDTDTLRIDMSGGARITLVGKADRIEVNASGGAIVDLGGLEAKDAAVELSGGVVATLDVTANLTGNASGGVIVNLRTTPSSTDLETSGGAVVRQP